jgi:hypothetical protein
VEWRSNQVKAEKPLPHPNRATKRVKAELEIHMHHSFQSQNVHAGVILAFQFEMDLHATGQGAGMFFIFFFCKKRWWHVDVVIKSKYYRKSVLPRFITPQTKYKLLKLTKISC